VGSVLCLGLDPDPAGLPPPFSKDLAGVEQFAALVLETALPFAAAVKPNLAFYEAFGSEGIAALERLRARIPGDVPVLIDAKRADIGTTAARQAAAIVDGLAAHAVTLNPYLGRDAIDPFLARGAFVYVVCRTSNPAAAEVQEMLVAADEARAWPAEAVYARVARLATGWAPADRLGFVVGATVPRELTDLRMLVPDRAFLVPGIGAQGGDLEATLAQGPATAGDLARRPGGGLLVNVSRGIAGAPGIPESTSQAHVRRAVARAAAGWGAKVPVLSFFGA
jgi:orotidine 5'-phosphate decarboxylase subfamily 2